MVSAGADKTQGTSGIEAPSTYHSYGQVEFFIQSRKAFVIDGYRSNNLLEQILDERRRGYRAPGFSIVHRQLWALGDVDV